MMSTLIIGQNIIRLVGGAESTIHPVHLSRKNYVKLILKQTSDYVRKLVFYDLETGAPK